MITREEIIDILKLHSRYANIDSYDKVVEECDFESVAYDILSKLHLDAVSESVCDHELKQFIIHVNKCIKCNHLQKWEEKQTVR